MQTRTKERLTEAAQLVKETLGEEELIRNPGIVNSVLMSLALDALAEAIANQNEKLMDCIFRSAGHIAE